MNENLKKEIFMEGYSDGYCQCMVNVEGALEKYISNEEIIEYIINSLDEARREYLEANGLIEVVENY